ncbi:hypothetical protein WICMUC_001413 [Wickerhamomyces mucosus]|uniref:Heme-degrading domain-containing protein n=1 Tax=Wickerhamomyces mucosus TaxID=1378264 RepID=A0A9P8THC4_9ASCO|nr:hypothetical protein WICMUC_001413 [Wickerhamomyces mucosus]
MSNQLSVETLLQQEAQLTIPQLDAATAFSIGSGALTYAADQYNGKSVVIDITAVSGATLFRAYQGQIQPDNELWVKKKRNTTIRYETSSLRFGKELASKGRTLADKGLDPLEYTNYGGSFPLRLRNAPHITIAVLTVSGLQDHQDHDVAVNAIKNVFKIETTY